jgi:hypothetical protein
MGRQPGVFPGQDSPIFRHKLLEQGDVFVIDGIDGEVDFGFRTGNPGSICATGFLLVGIGFTRHGLLDFAVNGVPSESGIELFLFNLLRLQLFVARGLIARRRLALLSSFSAFNGNDFSGHGRG